LSVVAGMCVPPIRFSSSILCAIYFLFAIFAHALPHGVMVTHLLLVQTFQVRVLVGQLKYIISARQSLVEQEASLSKSLLF
jgi:hypothetical protein